MEKIVRIIGNEQCMVYHKEDLHIVWNTLISRIILKDKTAKITPKKAILYNTYSGNPMTFKLITIKNKRH